MYGWTRKKWNKSHTKLIPKKHNGLDLKSPYGAPIYAMYDGNSKLITQYNKKGNVAGAGHYVGITSGINGKTVKVLYFHMQKNNRKSGTVKAGDIIGYQGDSGNLKNGIKQGYAVSHVHVKAQENGANVDPLPYLKTTIDPQTGKVTNPCN
ncbi:M23 family metallopeptidase [Maribacter sp. 2304DJ31-5]|uniref:M23 family metallopeptidase n=1 Tax=Maribacter sp. 2304DJ31-5 TaxID=3386273 RepID=UPI0039BCD598